MSDALPTLQAPKIGRRVVLTGLLAPVFAHAAPRPTVVMLGDSLTAGYGLAAADALPAQLQAALARAGQSVKVVAAGVSGDTTADGLARVDFSVPAGTALCIVELGGNDLLQGVEPKVTQRNLEQICARLKARHIPVLLVGLKAPPVVGAGYARDFDAAIAAAAKAAAVPFYPDWFGRVSDPALRQADGIHPNAKGVRLLAARLAPIVLKALPQSR